MTLLILNNKMEVYIYSLSDPRTPDNIRYIGKSENPDERLRKGHLYEKSNNHKDNWVQSLRKEGLKPKVELIDKVSVIEWQFWEKHYISLFRSWEFDLTNGTDGGDGRTPGFIVSEETRKKLSHPAWNKGKNVPLETREKISSKLKGNKPWNTGTKGIKKPNSGSFKKGIIPKNKTTINEELLKSLLLKYKNKEITQLQILKELHIGYNTLIKLITK